MFSIKNSVGLWYESLIQSDSVVPQIFACYYTEVHYRLKRYINDYVCW